MNKFYGNRIKKLLNSGRHSQSVILAGPDVADAGRGRFHVGGIQVHPFPGGVLVNGSTPAPPARQQQPGVYAAFFESPDVQERVQDSIQQKQDLHGFHRCCKSLVFGF